MKNRTILFFFLFCILNASAQDWQVLSTPVNTNLILFDISFPPGQDYVGYTGGSSLTFNGKGKILKTINLGSSWEVIYENEDSGSGVSAIHFLDTENGFAGTQDGDLMQTADGGESWFFTDPDPNLDQGEISDIEFSDNENGVILTAWGGVYITSDGGNSWTPATTNVPGIAYQLSYAGPTTLFAIGNQQAIYKSSDGGHNWSLNFNGPLPFYINLGVHFADETYGLVTSEEGNVFVTTDGGDSWTNYTVENQFGLMRGALVIEEYIMYATGTPGAVYFTEDGGANWILDTPIDPNPSYYKIIRTESLNLFVTGSGSNGGTILRKLAMSPLFVTATITDVDCNGNSTGSIWAMAEFGPPPYFYEWSTGAMTNSPILSDLPAGIYSCTVSDNGAGLFVLEDLEVKEPTAILINTQSTDESSDGAADGAITVDISGGIPPYTYLWNNGATTEDLQNLEDGTYCLTATDSNGCEMVSCATIMPGPSSSREIPGLVSLEVFPNPVAGNKEAFLLLQFSHPASVQIEVLSPSGQVLSLFEKREVMRFQEKLDFSKYPSGLYLLKVRDLSGGGYIVKKLIR